MEGQLNWPATGASMPLTELTILQANASTSANYFTVFIEVHCSTAPASVDKILGKTCILYPETTTFLG